MKEKTSIVKNETKYYKVVLKTNIEGFAKNPTFYTTSNYFDVGHIEAEVANGISDLDLPINTKVKVVGISEIDAAECSNYYPIQSAYKPLKRAAYDMHWKMVAEDLKRRGCKHIKLTIFFKKIDEFIMSGCDCDEPR